jgi:hypothetical protein
MKRKCDFTSPVIQNEVLEMYGHQIVRQIANDVQAAIYFAIIVDGTIDISGNHQESICLRYIDKDLQPHEEFIGFYELQDTTGAAVANAIFDVLLRLNLPIENLRGQSFDGASNMSGVYHGCQAIVRHQQPLALYVHCGAHCINLIAQSSCDSTPLIRDALAVVQELGALFSTSSNTRASFNEISQQSGLSTTKIKPLCPTRWLVRVKAITSLLDQYSLVLDTLNKIGQSTSHVAVRSRGLHSQLTEGTTVLALLIALEILKPLEMLNRSLQSTNTTVGGMMQAVEVVFEDMQLNRSNVAFERVLQSATDFKGKYNLDEIRLPRFRQPPARLTGQARAYQPETVSDYYRPLMFQFIDVACQGLQERFIANKSLHEYKALEQILLSGVADDETRKLLAPYREIDWTSFSTELRMFHKHKKYSSLSEAAGLLRMMSMEMRSLFPEVEKLIKLLLVCPAATAEAERSFSALRRLKTWLRNTMLQDRLNHVAVCHVHQEKLDELNIMPLMRDFIARGRPDIRGLTFGHFI